MPLETSEQAPVPVRTVTRLVGEWIGRLGKIWVEGQIAELTRRGGTVFMTLRDPVAAVSVRVICTGAVLDATTPAPGVGARVVIWAKPEFNAARGSFALTACSSRPSASASYWPGWSGCAQRWPQKGFSPPSASASCRSCRESVGLICGRDSAAERDVLRNAARRWPAVKFRVEQVAVQGPRATEEIIEALQRLDADKAVDVIIIARGGGSVEDLLPFSDEDLVRAVAGCVTPVISAIGHEQDVPLLDLVADARASTPTDAARRAVPDVSEQLELIGQLRGRARRSLAGRLDREGSWLSAVRSRPALASPTLEIDRRNEQILGLAERGRLALATGLDRASDNLAHIRARLLALSPAATLRRGYSIVQQADATVVLSASQVCDGEALTVRFAADQLTVTAGRPHRS